MRAVSIALVSLVLLALAGCGDGDEPTTSTAARSAPQANGQKSAEPKGSETARGSKSAKAKAQAPPPSNDSGRDGPAALGDRYDPGASDGKVHGDGSIEGFGEAADDSEAQEAVAVAVGYYDARAFGDWERACDLLSSGIKEQFEQTFAGGQAKKVGGCEGVLAALAGGLPRKLRAQQAETIRFTGFRVEGDGGYALFVSDVIADGFVPMHRDEEGWRVAALAGSAL